MPAVKGRRRVRAAVLRRWIAVGALVLVALLYYRPVHAYLAARGQRTASAAAVSRLEDERSTLQRRLKASSSLAYVTREARALGFIRKGEHLFIVKNIQQWRREQHAGNASGK
jgi:cell division protein FtsB